MNSSVWDIIDLQGDKKKLLDDNDKLREELTGRVMESVYNVKVREEMNLKDRLDSSERQCKSSNKKIEKNGGRKERGLVEARGPKDRGGGESGRSQSREGSC